VWPRLRPREARAAALGFPWSQVSTATVVWEEGRVLAHAGLLAGDRGPWALPPYPEC